MFFVDQVTVDDDGDGRLGRNSEPVLYMNIYVYMYIFLICIRMMPEPSDLISFVAQDNSLEDDEAAIDPAAGTRYQLALQVLLGEKRFRHVDDRSCHEVVQIFKNLLNYTTGTS